MCQRPTSTGNANASDSALNASKKVALPTTMRACASHLENGALSRRASKSDAVISADRIMWRASQDAKHNHQTYGMRSQRFNVFRRRDGHRPCIVAIQPGGIVVTTFHPGICAG